MLKIIFQITIDYNIANDLTIDASIIFTYKILNLIDHKKKLNYVTRIPFALYLKIYTYL